MPQWRRSTLFVANDTRGVLLGNVRPKVTLRSNVVTGKLRLGFWVGGELLGGWLIPVLPPNLPFTITKGRGSAVIDGVLREFPGRVLDYHGERPPTDRMIPDEPFTFTLDQEPGKVVPVLVDITVEPIEAVA